MPFAFLIFQKMDIVNTVRTDSNTLYVYILITIRRYEFPSDGS